MQEALGAAYLVFLTLAVLLLAYWLVADARIWRTVRRLPTVRDALGFEEAQDPVERVCVVVPAHNEERGIEQMVRSLAAQDYPSLRVVLVLDRCTDRTRELAEAAIGGDERFEIIDLEECPADWAGKVHAIWNGYTRSRGARDADLLLFTDADTVFHPSLVRASVALLKRRRLGMLTLWSTLAVHAWFERVVQPACGLELMYQYPLGPANRASNRRAFANGQFILFTREAYEAIGTHQSVNSAVLEDMALAREVAARDIPAGVFLADGMLVVRMYPSWQAFRTGWKRIYIDCAKFKPRRMRKHALRIWIVSILGPLGAVGVVFLALLAPPEEPWLRWLGLAVGAAATLLWLTTTMIIYRLGRFPLWAAPLHPFGAFQVTRILGGAARELERGDPVRWGGREYHLQPRY